MVAYWAGQLPTGQPQGAVPTAFQPTNTSAKGDIFGGQFMNRRMLSLSTCALLLLCLAWIAGCAGRPYLIIDYRIPPESNQLKGRTVRLAIKDLREDHQAFTPRAAVEFKDFQERYSLAWITEDQSRILAGEHDLKGLFAQAFAKRLERMGVTIASESQANVPVFEVVLKTFKIDLKDRKWIAKVSYNVNLSSDSQWIAHEKIDGTAERVKVIGRKGADTVISEIFTDILNRVDLLKLFQQAKLADSAYRSRSYKSIL
jgi:hypothetical protein